jgi:cysteine-S-conjugate beta-lyase
MTMKDIDTLLSHVGRDPARYSGMVNTPVFRTSTVIFPNLAAYEKRRDAGFKSVTYGLHGTPTTFAFEEAVAQLEGGYQAVAMPNGLAAITGTLLALTRDGGHLLMTDGAYAPARNFCERQLRPRGVDIEYYDPLLGTGIAEKIRPNTIAVYTESPSSLSFEIQDIPAIARAAHARNIPVVMDNTWGTPYFFPSFAHGVDISIQAATKYIAGHSDLMMGVIITNEHYWQRVRETVKDFGYGVSPEDCWLALRGLRTIGVRLKQQMANAIEVACWLEARPEVSRVLYPALESHPGHSIWKRDFRGAASLFSFVLRPVDDAAVGAFVDALELFGIGSSWGGYESLINIAHVDRLRTATGWKPEGPMIRLHIGLESPTDLIADLEQAFVKLGSSATSTR